MTLNEATENLNHLVTVWDSKFNMYREGYLREVHADENEVLVELSDCCEIFSLQDAHVGTREEIDVSYEPSELDIMEELDDADLVMAFMFNSDDDEALMEEASSNAFE